MTWTTRQVAEACYITESELSKWISRNIFRPSFPTCRGRRRVFDWRDLACLALIQAARPHCLSLDVMGAMAWEFRKDLNQLEKFDADKGVYFFTAHWPDVKYSETVGLVDYFELLEVLQHGPDSIIIVDVAKAYQKALTAICASQETDRVLT